MTIPLVPSRPLVQPNRSLFAGMSRDQLQAALHSAQQAYLALSSGSQIASVSYAQGDGSRSVSYRSANLADLTQLIRQLQAQLGLPGSRRSALRLVF